MVIKKQLIHTVKKKKNVYSLTFMAHRTGLTLVSTVDRKVDGHVLFPLESLATIRADMRPHLLMF